MREVGDKRGGRVGARQVGWRGHRWDGGDKGER